jgi:glucose-6-phosphate dehydrogenase assembly protein OpcA
MEAGVTATLDWTADSVGLDQVLAQMSEFSEVAASDPELSLTGTLNVVAIANGPEQRAECSRIIEGLADSQPSRAIVLQVGGEKDSGRFSARCRLLPGSNRHVCVEHIALRVMDSPPLLRSVASRLIRPELPTHLWWRGLPDMPLLEALAPLACRLVIEAEKAGEARQALTALVDLVDAAVPAVGDLGWAATTGWRQLLLGVLDEAAWQGLERGPSRLSLRAGGSCLRAWLIGGWMAEIVGPSLEVDVARSGEHEPVTEMTLESPEGVMTITANAGNAEVDLQRPSGTNLRRCLALHRRQTAELLAGELELRQRDRPFEAAVRRGAELVA